LAQGWHRNDSKVPFDRAETGLLQQL